MIAIRSSRQSDLASDRSFKSQEIPFLEDLQQQYINVWREFQPHAQVSVEPTVEGALSLAKASDQGQGMQTLITGSLYLVGSALRLLEPCT